VKLLHVVDSHTEGEPTRVITAGFPELTATTMAARRDEFRSRFDDLRRLTVLEPRGYDAVVGALLTPPEHATSQIGVIFFNDVGYLGMCGHGTMGLVRTLEHLGIAPVEGVYRIDTPVGTVSAERGDDGLITISNVASYAYQLDVAVGDRSGDIAYGGNWFFLTPARQPIEPGNISSLLAEANQVRDELRERGITGADGAEIDHIELVDGHRVFVLCPGAAWDRSPCGTGTSAKMATLALRGKLQPGEVWTQESVVGGKFFGSYVKENDRILPTIRGRAFITAEADLFRESDDFLQP
jgi:4-hydroxyproline epimerase